MDNLEKIALGIWTGLVVLTASLLLVAEDEIWWADLVGLLSMPAWFFTIFRFTFVKEGTAKLVVRFGAYKKTLLAKKGHKVNDDGEIVGLQPGEKPPFTLPGGLRFIGVWPFDKIYIQKDFRWIKINPDNTAENKGPEDVKDFLVLDYVYGIRIIKAEDTHLIPLEALLSVTAWNSNPSKAYLRGVHDWFRTLVGRISPYVRKFIAVRSYEKIEETDLEKEIIEALNNDKNGDGVVAEMRKRYGITIRSVEVINIDPGDEFRELTIQKRRGQMNAQQAVEETAGRVLESVAKTVGLAVDELKQELKNHPEKRGLSSDKNGYKEAFAYAEDQVKRDRAAEKGLNEIRVGNLDGTSFNDPSIGSLTGLGPRTGLGPILAGLAAIFEGKNKPSRGNPGGGSGGKGKKKKDITKEDEDDEEDEDWDSQRLPEK